jgi:hypothetical protein
MEGRFTAMGGEIAVVADALRKGRTDVSACPVVADFTVADWAKLDALAQKATNRVNKP